MKNFIHYNLVNSIIAMKGGLQYKSVIYVGFTRKWRCLHIEV